MVYERNPKNEEEKRKAKNKHRIRQKAKNEEVE